jgi:glycosyltransferase involved in cell wall biosynthesis
MTLNKYSKVSILASWFETTGLAGLEAGITGANAVVTEKGYTKEYYSDKAWYCDPESEASIKNSVLSAYNAKRGSKGLEDHIKKMNLTWENAAKMTCQVYLNVLNRK